MTGLNTRIELEFMPPALKNRGCGPPIEQKLIYMYIEAGSPYTTNNTTFDTIIIGAVQFVKICF